MNIIFFENQIESLSFFSHELADAYRSVGMDILFLDFKNPAGARNEIRRFNVPGSTVLLTFNFIGLSGEAAFDVGGGITIWDTLEIQKINILVDHPLYYAEQLLGNSPELMQIFCIDRFHLKFLQEHFPKYERVCFLPLAGNRIKDDHSDIPINERSFDLFFMANYIPLELLDNKLKSMDEDYRIFYKKIIDRLISDTNLPLETELFDAVSSEFKDTDTDSLIMAMHGMLFIDIYVRTYFRQKIISLISDSGQKILIAGKNWDCFACRHPENIITTGILSSEECLMLLKDSRISLNIMPWFKDGAHDRIFSSMLAHTPCLTDMSKYLYEILSPSKDCLTYTLEDTDALPHIINDALKSPDYLEEIKECAYKKASLHHTWKNRAKDIIFSSFFP